VLDATYMTANKRKDAENTTTSKGKDRAKLISVLRRGMKACDVDCNGSVLVIGASRDDLDLLQQADFTNITVSNVSAEPINNTLPQLKLNAEALDLPDESFDLVFAHAVLHHCRSPHIAFCEMLRVARRQVMFFEPNDSLFMRFLTKAGFSFPYEIPAVVDNGFTSGGLGDTQIPNFIYRWNGNEVLKTTFSYLAEREFRCFCYAYWDFYVNERELAVRQQTRIGAITKVIGARNFIMLLRLAQSVLNLLPPARSQGNKFFACVLKQPQLRPWLKRHDDGIIFNREFVGAAPDETTRPLAS
jgi:SAM-dependent methyltransferase